MLIPQPPKTAVPAKNDQFECFVLQAYYDHDHKWEDETAELSLEMIMMQRTEYLRNTPYPVRIQALWKSGKRFNVQIDKSHLN